MHVNLIQDQHKTGNLFQVYLQIVSTFFRTTQVFQVFQVFQMLQAFHFFHPFQPFQMHILPAKNETPDMKGNREPGLGGYASFRPRLVVKWRQLLDNSKFWYSKNVLSSHPNIS